MASAAAAAAAAAAASQPCTPFANHCLAPLPLPQAPSSSNATDGGSSKVSISADVLKTLAEAEAARAEQAGSSASAQELQSTLADSIERIVEQVRLVVVVLKSQLGWGRVQNVPGGLRLGWHEVCRPGCRMLRTFAGRRLQAALHVTIASLLPLLMLARLLPVPQAKKLAEEEGKGDTAGEQAVRRELESIIETVGLPTNGVDPQDLKCVGAASCFVVLLCLWLLRSSGRMATPWSTAAA